MSQNKILSKIIFRLSIPFRKLLLRRKNVFFKKNVKLDSRTSFEGNSYIYKNCRIINSKIGFGTYVANDSILINSIVGKYCSIASNVKTIIGNHPLSPFVSTHPAFFSTKRQAGFTYTRTNKFSDFKYLDEDKRISFIIGNDVWIGSDVKLLEGIRVGDGSVIATGSLVTRDIPPYEIWGGVPAKKIKDRFNSEIKEILLKFRWWEKPQIWIIESQDKFENIYSFIQHINIEIQSEMMRKIK